MIHSITSLCKITENSFNIHFLLIGLNTLSVSLKEGLSVDTLLDQVRHTE